MRYWYCLIGLVMVLPAAAQEDPHIRKGNRYYREGQFDKALSEYQRAKETPKNASDPALNYNLGNTLFRLQSFDEAAEAYNNSLSNRQQGEEQQHTYYNKGVALSRGKKLEASVEAYKNALRLDPGDQDARINLQKALFELKRQQPRPEDQEDQQQHEPDENEQEERPQPPGSLSKKQAEQLLRALSQREQQVQQKIQQLRNRGGMRQEKDW